MSGEDCRDVVDVDESSSESSSGSSSSSSSNSSSSSSSSGSSESVDSGAASRDHVRAEKDIFKHYMRALQHVIHGHSFAVPPSDAAESATLAEREEYAEYCRKRIEDKVKVRRDLLCSSTIWKAGFVAVLDKYSQVEAVQKSSCDDGDVCAACGKHGSHLLTFTGVSYSAKTLWMASGPDAGKVIRSLARQSGTCAVAEDGLQCVGPGCREAAVSYHKLHHWKLHMIQFIQKSLKNFSRIPDGDCIAQYDSFVKLLHNVESRFLEGTPVTEPNQTTLDAWAQNVQRHFRPQFGRKRSTKPKSQLRARMQNKLNQADIRTMMTGKRQLHEATTVRKKARTAPKPTRQTTLLGFTKPKGKGK